MGRYSLYEIQEAPQKQKNGRYSLPLIPERIKTAFEEVKGAEEKFKEVSGFLPTVKRFVTGLPKAALETEVQIGQVALRGYAAIGAKIQAKDLYAKFAPETTFQKELLGTEDPITFSSLTEEVLGEKRGRQLGPFTPVLGAFFAVADAIPTGKQIKQIGNTSYKINAAVDDFFRGTHYVNVAAKEAKRKILKETGEKLNNTIELLKYAKQEPEIMAKAINSVEDFFYGASKLSPFERQVIRRFLPFYSWYKFIGLYGL